MRLLIIQIIFLQIVLILLISKTLFGYTADDIRDCERKANVPVLNKTRTKVNCKYNMKHGYHVCKCDGMIYYKVPTIVVPEEKK